MGVPIPKRTVEAAVRNGQSSVPPTLVWAPKATKYGGEKGRPAKPYRITREGREIYRRARLVLAENHGFPLREEEEVALRQKDKTTIRQLTEENGALRREIEATKKAALKAAETLVTEMKSI
jgi:DNA-binding PadR family transcriptional regulator